MGIREGKYNRVFRCHHLAMRMIRLGARPSTVVAWAKVTRERAGELAREYRQEVERNAQYLRGPSPTSLATLLSSAYMRQELTAMAGVCQWVEVLPPQRLCNARVMLPTVERGERLCDAVDIFREMVPHSQLTMEQIVLLVTALAEGKDCHIVHCPECSSVMLVDPLAPHRRVCTACEREAKTARWLAESREDALIEPGASLGTQQSLF